MNIFTSILPNRALRRAGLILAAAAMATAAFAGPVQQAHADSSPSFPSCQVCPDFPVPNTPRAMPDLIATSLTAKRLTSNPDFVEFAFTVKNQGNFTAKAGALTVLIIDNYGTEYWEEPQLGPGQAVTHKTIRYLPINAFGVTHTMGVVVDQDFEVTESNEKNQWTEIKFS